jgi:hypothetical protein
MPRRSCFYCTYGIRAREASERVRGYSIGVSRRTLSQLAVAVGDSGTRLVNSRRPSRPSRALAFAPLPTYILL